MSHFNQVANDWDNDGKVAMMQKLASEAKKALDLSGTLDIMDFGTGTGLFGLEFQEYIKTLTGIDTSQGMLDVFNKKTENFSNIKSININLEEEPLDEKYDLIISSMAFHHLKDPQKLINKLKENLKPHGKIAIVDLDKEDGTFHPDNEGMGVQHFGFTQEELKDWAKSANLEFSYTIINTIHKNDKDYHQFLALYQN